MNNGEQIPLQFFQFDPLTLSQFIVGKNSDAVDYIQSIINNEQTKPLYVWGNDYTGKSHLLQAACESAAQSGQKVAYVPVEIIITHTVQSLDGLENQDIVCIDDIDLISGNKEWENAFFHLYNRIVDNKNRLIISADKSPASIDIELADLKSRLAGGYVCYLEELSDKDKITLLQQKASQRAFDLGNDVAEYLIKRVNRDPGHLLHLLDQIDRDSLAQKRKITIPFVKSILEKN